ncbi:MAG: hypothetical protein Q7S21_03140 [archaeon]|nr:hypothetical protein [archaeon]
MAKAGGGFQKRSFRVPSKGGKEIRKNGLSPKQNRAKELLAEIARRREQAQATKPKKRLTDIELNRALSEINLKLDELKGDKYNAVGIRIREHVTAFEEELDQRLKSSEINEPQFESQLRMKRERMMMLMEEIIMRYLPKIDNVKSTNYWTGLLKVKI